MEHKEKLYALEKAIRKVIPRLTELSEGVLLKRRGKSNYAILKFKRDDYSSYIEYRGEEQWFFSMKNREVLDRYEIIGHNILLSDLLRWLNTKEIMEMLCTRFENKVSYPMVSLTGDGFVDISYCEPEYSMTQYLRIGQWDLSKPYLKDQSEEFINSLYKLVKED